MKRDKHDRRWFWVLGVLAAVVVGWRMAPRAGDRAPDASVADEAPTAAASTEPPREAAPVAAPEAPPALAAGRPRTPVPAPAVAAVPTDPHATATVPEQDRRVDPEYQARQRGRIVALAREQLPMLQARSEALAVAGAGAHADELRFRLERLRARLSTLEKQGPDSGNP